MAFAIIVVWLYIISPVACAAMLSKSTSQRLLDWRTLLKVLVRHSSHPRCGESLGWGAVLSCLQPAGVGAADSGEEVRVWVRSIAVAAPTDADYSFSSMGEFPDRQVIYTDSLVVLDSALGRLVCGENGLYRIDHGGHANDMGAPC